MKSAFRPTTPGDRDPLSRFLADSFNTTLSAPSLEPSLMSWKYWDPREDWSEPRSYVLERDGRIVAHAGLWPLVFDGSAGTPPARGVHMIDWASAKDSPGTGLALVQKLAGIFDFIFAIGGSEMTRKVLPAFGFKETARSWTAARPLRPVRQILTHQARNWKLGARLIRNFGWAHAPAASPAPGWRSVPIDPARLASLNHALFGPRPPGFFLYFLRCPSVRNELYAIEDSSGLQGYFLLGNVRGQARLAGLWLREPSEENWRTAYALARNTAQNSPAAFELVLRGSEGPSSRAAAQAGFRMVENAPVYLLTKKPGFAFPPDFQFQFCDDDEAFLDTGAASYRT